VRVEKNDLVETQCFEGFVYVETEEIFVLYKI